VLRAVREVKMLSILKFFRMLLIGAMVVGPLAPSVASQPAAATSFAGFGVTYRAPSGWTLSGGEGRIHAWADPAQTAALVMYTGHFSTLALALGDAQRVLGVPRDEDTHIVKPLASVRFGTRAGMAGALRVKGERSVLAHVAVVQLDDSTVLGAVALLDGAASDSALQSATVNVASVLTAAQSSTGTRDAALQSRLTGEWTVQVVHTSSPTGGGYTNEESWTFAPAGTYAYRKKFSVSLPGAAVTPEERDEQGTWYTVGGALVLQSSEGRLTIDVQFKNDKLVLDGTTFNKR